MKVVKKYPIFVFLQVWNELLLATIFTTGKVRTLTVGIQQMSGQYQTDYGSMGAALVIAGLAAEGTTVVEDIHFVERGYENLTERLQSLGARITKVCPAD